jgi:anti-anti-sigma factor
MAAFAFNISSESDVQVVELTGRLDSNTAPEFDKKIAEVPGARIVLDLASLEYISSAGLRSVLGALKRANAAGGKLALAAPIPSVVEVFEISGFITLITVYPDRAGAVAALR